MKNSSSFLLKLGKCDKEIIVTGRELQTFQTFQGIPGLLMIVIVGPKLKSNHRSKRQEITYFITSLFEWEVHLLEHKYYTDKIDQSCPLFKLPRQSSPQGYFCMINEEKASFPAVDFLIIKSVVRLIWERYAIIKDFFMAPD